MIQVNKFLNKALWLILALITLSAIVLIRQFSPYIPDYDGLDYFRVAKLMNGWLFSPSDHKIYMQLANEALAVAYWPISNALSVCISALFIQIIDTNLLPSLINSLYLFLFVSYLTKIKSVSYVFIATLLLCSHTFFFRLFTTLTTEFSVGLWIFAFLLTLNSSHERRGIYLAVLTVLGLLLRTLDVVFILMSVSAYNLIHYALWKNRQHIFTSLSYVGFTLILTLPLFFQHYKTTFDYVYQTSFGATAASWKLMSGVSDRYDVIQQYIKFLFLYNPLVLLAAIVMIIFSFYLKTISKRHAALVVGSSLSVCFPLLMASSLNIMVVFWVYIALLFIICELGFLIYNDNVLRINKLYFPRSGVIKNGILVGFLVAFMFFMYSSWDYEVPYLKHQSNISKIAYEISRVIDNEEGTPTIATNYAGIGPLNEVGLSWHRSDILFNGGIDDIYSKNKHPSDYLVLKGSTNFFITAHDTYFFPSFLGINDHIKETHDLFTLKSSEFGFRKVKEISGGGRSFDIWYRPGVQVYLQYSSYGDNWISRNLPIKIGAESLCSGEKVSGKLYFSVNFPNPSITNYKPPFLITLNDKNSNNILSKALVNNYGDADVILDVQNISCGEYVISFDNSFSTNNDARNLSAMFVKLEGAIKFVDIK